MKINFNQLDNNKKQLQFTDGIYNLEINNGVKWVWTSQEFGGVVSNIEYVTLIVASDVDNILYYDDNEVEVHPECLNIVKLKTKDKSEFLIKLKNPYIVLTDSRILGIKILSISADNEIIF